MTQEEYKKVSKALEEMTEKIVNSLDNYNREVKKMVDKPSLINKQLKKINKKLK